MVAIDKILNPWCLVCAAKDLTPGKIVPVQVNEQAMVIFRGTGGEVYALEAHCSHLGTHLKNGQVIHDTIQCPLHHWRYSGSTGNKVEADCRKTKCSARQRTYPVKEVFGCIFVASCADPPATLPVLDIFPPNGYLTQMGKSVELNCNWVAVAANGFDMQHLQSVHKRKLLKEPVIREIETGVLELKMEVGIIGDSLSEKLLKFISGNKVSIQVRSYAGNIVTIESKAGKTQSALMLSFLPSKHEGVVITPIYIVPKKRFRIYNIIRLKVTSWLFYAFIKKDISIMDAMHFLPQAVTEQDRVLLHYLKFIQTLTPHNHENDAV